MDTIRSMKTGLLKTGRSRSGRRYGGADPAERLAQRRARILEVGIELFGTRGYAQTTLGMLSAESGVAHRYLTQIFPTKEAILREIYLDIFHDVTQAVRVARQSPLLDPLGQIHRDVGAACSVFFADPRRLRIDCVEVIGVSAEFEQLRRKVIRDFGALILEEVNKLVASGVLPAAYDYHAGAIGLVGAFHELMTEWVLTPAAERPQVDVVIAQIQEFFRGMLLAVLNPVEQ